MDKETRIYVSQQRDAAVRRSLGLNASTHVSREHGSRARRWTDTEIEAAVKRISGGQPMTRHAYKLARRNVSANDAPSHNTVAARRPDLFAT